jgi:hypothetical protein
MHQVNLTDTSFAAAKRLAAARGFSSVEEFAAEVIDEKAQEQDIQSRFTPEVIAYLDEVSTGIKAGAKTYDSEEVSTSLDENKAAWLKKNAS